MKWTTRLANARDTLDEAVLAGRSETWCAVSGTRGADQGLAVCPWSPLDGGFLTGKYSTGNADEGSRADLDGWDMSFSDQQRRVLEAVQSVADELEATPAQVSLRWLMDQREFTCVPIFGARTAEQMEENVGAVDVSLTDDQYERIADAY